MRFSQAKEASLPRGNFIVTRISVRPITAPTFEQDGVRPVNLRTDLRPLADLIELVFADSMDSSGRSAVREMRYLSQLGYGLKLIARMNELALGISLGFVYIMDASWLATYRSILQAIPKHLAKLGFWRMSESIPNISREVLRTN